ncbi:MAG: glycoside hydrolase family 18 [Herbinix sp.]|nr:glycoside hydrolase family 18 [Herbinix sp.]
MGRWKRDYLWVRKWLGILLIIVFTFNSLYGSVAYARSSKADRTPPSAPRNLIFSSVTDTSARLSWNASTDNIAVTYYEIYKNSALAGTTTSLSYQVTGLSPSTNYSFYIIAKDAAGNRSKSSNIAVIKTNPSLPISTPSPLPTATPVPTATPTPAAPAQKVIGYYAAWAAYSGFTPDKIDVSKLTHINYAFANIGSDYKITLGYPDVDPANLTKLVTLKRSNPNLKLLIAVGGWSWSARFSDAALTDASRTVFADSCVDFIVKYGMDGVDIDWEYPVSGGLSTNIRRPEDKYNFTLLMQKLREKLDARGAIDGKEYILSFAGAAGAWYLNNIQAVQLAQYVDFANIMTYDLHGSWDSYTDLNAPLFNNSDLSPQYKESVDQSINAWLQIGFPAEKMIMGVPFYGYIYKAVTNSNDGLYQTYSGAASISYANIAANYLNSPGYIRYFHSESMVPWLFNGTNFISYDDEETMSLKASYITGKGLGGAMIWELSQDPGAVLLNALYNGLQ